MSVDYEKYIEYKKKCMDYSLNDLIKASRGIYIYKNNNKNDLCRAINEAYEEKKHPIVHEDSLTAWGNRAVEEFGLNIKDIYKMEPGEKMDVILLDRNVGDYMDGTKPGTKYNPTVKGLSYATYIHGKDLTGILTFTDIGVVRSCFEWEINSTSINGLFWSPINHNKTDIKKLNPLTKIGWRGPAIRLSDAKKYLPKSVTHYDTWWDDYLSYRNDNFLKMNK